VKFLAPEWFDQARPLLAPVEISPTASARVQFDAGERWALVVEQGRIAHFDRGDIDGADVEVRWSREEAFAIWRRELRDDGAMQATTVVAAVLDGTYTGPPAPGDFFARPELRDLPEIPGASLVAQYRFKQAPFGVTNHFLTFADGRCIAGTFGTAEHADVLIEVFYEVIGPVRHGERTILEAIADGTVEGEMGPLALLAGIVESPEYRAAELATGRHPYALAVLGELDADERYASAFQQLARASTLD
jgi:hypothetical protein